jgi:hypothetical protein
LQNHRLETLRSEGARISSLVCHVFSSRVGWLKKGAVAANSPAMKTSE